MTAKITNVLHVTDIKEITTRVQARANEIDIHLPRAKALELIAAAFGGHNFHEVSSIFRSMVFTYGQTQYDLLDAVNKAFDNLAKEGSSQIKILVSANDDLGEMNLCTFSLDRQATRGIIERAFAQTSSCPMPEVNTPSPSFLVDQIEFINTPDMGYFSDMGYLYATFNHKHDGGGCSVTSASIKVKDFLLDILMPLAVGQIEEERPKNFVTLGSIVKKEGLLKPEFLSQESQLLELDLETFMLNTEETIRYAGKLLVNHAKD